MTHKAPGKAYRDGLTLPQLMDMFPTEAAAIAWFEGVLWDGERCCGKCGSTRTREASHKYMPYWCSDCRSYFSVRTSTPMAHSKIPLRKWAIAIYLCLTSLKSVSSMKLHRDIGVSQPAAWFMLHRIREAWVDDSSDGNYAGPIEVDETYVGSKRRNMKAVKRESLDGRGTKGKTPIVGMKDREGNRVRAKVVGRTDAKTLQAFVVEHAEAFATVYTDEAKAYRSLPYDHEAVKHSVGEVRSGPSPHERRGVVLVNTQAGSQGYVPQDQPEAPGPLRPGVRRQAQHAGIRNAYADARHRRQDGRAQPSLPRPHHPQRA